MNLSKVMSRYIARVTAIEGEGYTEENKMELGFYSCPSVWQYIRIHPGDDNIWNGCPGWNVGGMAGMEYQQFGPFFLPISSTEAVNLRTVSLPTF